MERIIHQYVQQISAILAKCNKSHVALAKLKKRLDNASPNNAAKFKPISVHLKSTNEQLDVEAANKHLLEAQKLKNEAILRSIQKDIENWNQKIQELTQTASNPSISIFPPSTPITTIPA